MKLSEHFDSTEFACRHCGQLPEHGMDGELIQLLEAIRELSGNMPMTIMSGYRCPTHNRNIGGAKSSQHMLGTAADIKIPGLSPKQVAGFAEKLIPNKGGIGVYSIFTHVDVRTSRARW
jgi:uncharacterized protein YcbK (DUF882 family)